jgi:ABC-type dipeptide/oligopeptide/nickel transport system permease component
VLTYVLERIIGLVPVLLGVSLLVFTLTWLAPGDPVVALVGESAQGISREALEDLRRSYGLDRPLPVQYWDYLSGALQGDLGRSVRSGLPVAQEIAMRFPATLRLTLAGMAVAVTLGISLGLLAAVYRRTLVDYVAIVLALIGVSVPVFWSGLILMIIFALELGWLPASGSGSWRHLVMPAFAIGFASSAFIARITRSSMIETLRHDYVRTARAKGVVSWRVNVRHAFRNALLPVVTVVGLQFGSLLGGAVLTETVFAYPGVGRMLVDAIRARDLPLIQGTVLFVSVVFVLINLAVDVSYAALNPKIRYE